MEAQFRAGLRRCLEAADRGDAARAGRLLEQFFRTCLVTLETARIGMSEVNGALSKLNRAFEDDRRRLAHELHDEAGQLLAAVHIALHALARDVPPRAQRRVEEVRAQLDGVQEQLRRISHELRPTILDDLGLMPALKFLAEGVSGRSGIEIVVEGSTRGRLPSQVELTLYRVVQEALTNAVRHSRATSVHVRVRPERQAIVCAVRDDGVGVDENILRGHGGYNALGLMGIRIRVASLGGSLRIDSRPGSGTHLRVTIPLEGYNVASRSSRR